MATCTRGLKRGCPMQDGKIDNKNKNFLHRTLLHKSFRPKVDQNTFSHVIPSVVEIVSLQTWGRLLWFGESF